MVRRRCPRHEHDPQVILERIRAAGGKWIYGNTIGHDTGIHTRRVGMVVDALIESGAPVEKQNDAAYRGLVMYRYTGGVA